MNKNAHYQIGERLNPEALAAQWNAVNIDGETYLLDVFWASTCIDASATADWAYL
jgi:hypothetical protein